MVSKVSGHLYEKRLVLKIIQVHASANDGSCIWRVGVTVYC